jgi:two-component system NtrC family sensor kinase
MIPHILVVDDNPEDCSRIKRALRRKFPDVQVKRVAGEQDLVQALETNQFDLAITDFKLGWTDGLTVLRAVKSHKPDCPVIMFTSTGSEDVAVEAMKAGLDDYVRKSPRYSARLVAAVRSALEKAGQRESERESKARLLQKDQQRAAELQALYEASLHLNAQLKTSRVLRLIAEQAVNLLEAEWSDVYLYDADRSDLILSSAAGELGQAMPATVKPGEGLTGRVFDSRRSLVAADDEAGGGRVLGSGDVKSWLGVPLMRNDLVLGVLAVASKTKSFDDHAVWLAELFAAQATMALQNARIHEEVQIRARERTALHRAGQAIAATLDLDQVLQLVIAEVKSLVGAEGATVLLRDRDRGELYFAAAAGPGSEELLGLRLPGDAGVAGSVVRNARSVLVEDARRDPRFYDQVDAHTGMTTRSMVAVPLMIQEVAEGVVEAINKADGAFVERDREVLEVMAGSAAVAIANARLYQAEREQFRRLQQSQAQLIQAEKMAAMGRLVASIAHEINNPLQAVQGCLTLAEEELEELQHERLKRYLTMADTEMQRIASIVRRVRDFYRPAPADLKPTDIHAVLTSLLELVGKQLQENNITVERDWAAELPMIEANPSYLKQVFLNLVLNAVDAMSEHGGTLRVHTSLDQMQSPREKQQTPAVRIEFTDTGTGMPPEVMAHLFEPFVTAKKDGTGLGLSISYGIIEAHDGQISATSQVGVGSSFTVMLPVSEALATR